MVAVHRSMARAAEAPPLAVEEISGAVVEVADLDRTRAFYAPIFEPRGGLWEQARHRVRYRAGSQTIEFIHRAHPRSFPESAYHHAYRVSSHRLHPLAEELDAAGHRVDWWHEDHPAELAPSAYVHDPSGNRVQLLAAEEGPLLDHVALEEHDLEHAEFFYTKALGGQVTFHHGWDMADYRGLEAWMAGDDPSAPWTRRINLSYRDRRPQPLPVPHVFLSFGQTRLGLFLTEVHRQEPAPDRLRGTPRIVLRAACTPGDLANHLSAVNISPVFLKYDSGHVRYRRDGRTLFLRDPGGHFVQVECRG